MSDDHTNELRRRIAVAKADVDQCRGSMINDMDLIYADSVGACGKITRFAMKHGEKALLAKLETDPAFFGGLKGHIGSGKFLTLSGFSERAVAKEYVQALPAKAKALQAAENKLYDLQRALSGDFKSFELGVSKGRGSGPEIP